MTPKNGGTDRMLGEVHGMVREYGKQLDDVFALLREVREQGCVKGAHNAMRIKAAEEEAAVHNSRITKMEAFVLKGIGALSVLVVLIQFGPKLLELMK